MTRVYCIIPVYMVEKYLCRCVDSVLNQTHKDIQIILVDDGSKDGCPQICDRYADENRSIIVIHKENGGLSSARNAALDYIMNTAKDSEYLFFLDSDDFIAERFVERLLQLCELNDCQVAQCEYQKGDADEFSESLWDESVTVLSKEDSLLGYKLKSQMCAKLFKVSTFMGGLRFPVGLWNEDEFVIYRAVYSAKNVAFTNEKLYYYYQHSDSIMNNVANRLKNNPHRHDYLLAYEQRAEFFKDNPRQLQKTHEKVCTDIILRYCEQMFLKKHQRDDDCTSGEFLRMYKKHYPLMIHRKGMPLKRKLMYIAFRYVPYSGVIMGKIFTLRK